MANLNSMMPDEPLAADKSSDEGRRRLSSGDQSRGEVERQIASANVREPSISADSDDDRHNDDDGAGEQVYGRRDTAAQEARFSEQRRREAEAAVIEVVSPKTQPDVHDNESQGITTSLDNQTEMPSVNRSSVLKNAEGPASDLLGS